MKGLTSGSLIGAPRRILLRHTDDKRHDLRLRARATDAPLRRPVVLVRDEPPVPAQDRVGCHDAGHGGESSSAEEVAFYGETAALVVVESNRTRVVHGAEHAVLLPQVVNDVLLLAIDPA